MTTPHRISLVGPCVAEVQREFDFDVTVSTSVPASAARGAALATTRPDHQEWQEQLCTLGHESDAEHQHLKPLLRISNRIAHAELE